MSENELMIRVQDVKKQYRLGQIGGGTYGVEDWVPGIQFQLVDTFATYYEGWNRRAWGPICLPEPAVTLGAEE